MHSLAHCMVAVKHTVVFVFFLSHPQATTTALAMTYITKKAEYRTKKGIQPRIALFKMLANSNVRN